MSDSIQRSREAALSFLKPTAGQLERGLELHANSIVCDSFGFLPRSIPDTETLRQLAERGASYGEYQDVLEEMLMIQCARSDAGREEFHEAWEASGVTCLLVSAGEESQDPAQLIKRMARISYLADVMGEQLCVGSEVDDVIECKKKGLRCLYPSSNGGPLAGQRTSVEYELGFIRVFFQLGYRMMHLTYNRRNAIGDGCGERADGGLSDFGSAVVAEMNRVGVMVDVAHSGQRTSREAAEQSSVPIAASHTTCHSLNPHIRGKTDEVIEAIVEGGGYVGICAIGSFLGRSQNIVALLDHVDYVAKRFGVDHVAIGTDVDHVFEGYREEMRNAPKAPACGARWEHLWPEGSYYYREREQPDNLLSLAWTNWPMFTVGLVQRGYSDGDIQKIIGQNVLRVARDAIRADAGYRLSQDHRDRRG